jgi:hypothetical protein
MIPNPTHPTFIRIFSFDLFFEMILKLISLNFDVPKVLPLRLQKVLLMFLEVFKTSQWAHKVPKVFLNMFPKKQHMEHLPSNGLHPHMPYLSHYLTEGTT